MEDRRIVVDSCVDFNDSLFSKIKDLYRVPFKITIDGEEYIDDEQVVVDELKARNYQSKEIKTACPSPGDFYTAMKDAAESFVVIISSKLSGAYQSAKTALSMLMEEENGKEKKVHLFDSKSASAGETLITIKIMELIQNNETFTQIVEKTEEYIDSIRTLFVLESMDTLVSNGRVSKVQQIASKALKLTPIMGEDGEGNIERKGMARGEKNVIPKLLEVMSEDTANLKNRTLAITHVNAPDKADEVKKQIEDRYLFKEIHIFEASGLSSVYASDGGIILAY